MSTLYGVPKKGIAYDESNWHPYPVQLTSAGNDAVPGTTTTGASWRRCHPTSDSIEIMWTFRQTVAGTAGSGTYLINLPQGFHINPKVFASTGALEFLDQGQSAPINLGPAYLDTTGNSQIGFVMPYGSADLNKLMLMYIVPGSAPILWAPGNYPISNTNINVAIRAVVPVREYAVS
jgi:hypothetical protein